MGRASEASAVHFCQTHKSLPLRRRVECLTVTKSLTLGHRVEASSRVTIRVGYRPGHTYKSLGGNHKAYPTSGFDAYIQIRKTSQAQIRTSTKLYVADE